MVATGCRRPLAFSASIDATLRGVCGRIELFSVLLIECVLVCVCLFGEGNGGAGVGHYDYNVVHHQAKSILKLDWTVQLSSECVSRELQQRLVK